MTTRVIFGCGYLGHRVALRWLAAGNVVYAVTRDRDRAASWLREGLRPIVADVTDRDSLRQLPEAESVLFAVSHDERRVLGTQRVPRFRVQEDGAAEPRDAKSSGHVLGLANVLDALPPTFRRLIYISSTGVYGDCRGDWIDEQTAADPQRASGKTCLAAEQRLESHRHGLRTVILRLAGLYGPGRIPRKDVILAGEPIDAPQHGYLNLIHVDDAVAAVLAADVVDATLPRTYLLSDGSPVVRGEYYAELARLVGAPPPCFRLPDEETTAHARATADKRIMNRRMLAELKFQLRYPTYRQGLKAIIAGK